MADFLKFYETIQRGGLESYNKYYGMYSAFVTSVADPEKRGRIQLSCQEAGHTASGLTVWVEPAFDGAAKQRGYFWPPQVGDVVRVAFDYGNVSRPLFYIGAWYAQGELPTELEYPSGDGTAPYRRGFVTQTGHLLVFDDEQGKEAVTLQWNKPKTYPADTRESASRTDSDKSYLKLLPDGSVEISNMNGSKVRIDADAKSVTIEDKDNSNTLTFTSDGVRLSTKGKVVIDGATAAEINADKVSLGENAAKSAVLGEDLIQWLNSHVHPTAVGPSAPPQPLASSALLSSIVKVK